MSDYDTPEKVATRDAEMEARLRALPTTAGVVVTRTCLWCSREIDECQLSPCALRKYHEPANNGPVASATYEPVVVHVAVPSQAHMYFRRPHRVADRLNALGDPFLPMITAVVAVEPSGLTSTWRNQS